MEAEVQQSRAGVPCYQVNECIALRLLYLAGRTESFCDSHRLCRFLRCEIFQMVWLPSPAVRNGEWVVIRVVGGYLEDNRPGGVLVGGVGRHRGGRRGLPDGKHGQVFASNMQRLPRPYPAAQCRAYGGVIEPNFLGDCPWPLWSAR